MIDRARVNIDPETKCPAVRNVSATDDFDELAGRWQARETPVNDQAYLVGWHENGLRCSERQRSPLGHLIRRTAVLHEQRRPVAFMFGAKSACDLLGDATGPTSGRREFEVLGHGSGLRWVEGPADGCQNSDASVAVFALSPHASGHAGQNGLGAAFRLAVDVDQRAATGALGGVGHGSRARCATSVDRRSSGAGDDDFVWHVRVPLRIWDLGRGPYDPTVNAEGRTSPGVDRPAITDGGWHQATPAALRLGCSCHGQLRPGLSHSHGGIAMTTAAFIIGLIVAALGIHGAWEQCRAAGERMRDALNFEPDICQACGAEETGYHSCSCWARSNRGGHHAARQIDPMRVIPPRSASGVMPPPPPPAPRERPGL